MALNFKPSNMQDFESVRNIEKEQIRKLRAAHLHSLTPKVNDGRFSSPIKLLVVGSVFGM